jgi:hypothetical protein
MALISVLSSSVFYVRETANGARAVLATVVGAAQLRASAVSAPAASLLHGIYSSIYTVHMSSVKSDMHSKKNSEPMLSN